MCGPQDPGGIMQDVSLLWTLGPAELLLMVVVAVFVFGPKRLPELGKALGDGLSSFRDASKGDSHRES